MFIVFRHKTHEIKKTDIVGTWRGGNQTAKIFENGKVILTDKRQNRQTSGTYELLDKNILRVTLNGSSPQDFKLSLSQDTLTLRSVGGHIVNQYKRVK